MKLSKRLECISEMISPESNVIDVGCDHGLLSIYLAQEKKCKCLACDINKNALNGAQNNINKYNAKNIELKLTDGINDIVINDSDYIVIAGMGTSTIKHILENKKLSNTLIISSNNQLFELRKFITSLGYKIVDEKFIIDHQKKYVIIKFVRGRKRYSNIDLKYGPIIRNDKQYLVYELEKLYQIKEKVKYSKYKVRYKNYREIKQLEKLITKGK